MCFKRTTPAVPRCKRHRTRTSSLGDGSRPQVICPGDADADQDGPALVSDPDLGFAGLRRFGPGLTQHMALKIRSGLKATNFMLVDSPGMIDAPGGNDLGAKQERGYHFENTVRWRAGRAEMPRGTSRGDAVETLWRRVAATPRPRRGDSVETGRSDAAAATWKFRGDESPRRRGRDLEIPS